MIDMMVSQESSPTRSGFVALVGATNAGKSTLVNQLVGAKVSIVTHKVQTTRAPVRAIVTHNHTQIVFIDMAGIFTPKKRLERAMIDAAWAGARDGDKMLVLVDAKVGLNEQLAQLMHKLEKTAGHKILVLNKVDLVKPELLLALSRELNDQVKFEATFMVSALKGSGCGDLLDYLAESLPEGPFYYDEDQISDQPMRQLAAEITREKLTLRLHQELPYESTVETESWREQKDGSLRIEQVIYVARDSQKKIILGQKGQTIKAIGQLARAAMAAEFGCKVHLFLFVKVRANWSDDPERLRAMGLN